MRFDLDQHSGSLSYAHGTNVPLLPVKPQVRKKSSVSNVSHGPKTDEERAFAQINETFVEKMNEVLQRTGHPIRASYQWSFGPDNPFDVSDMTDLANDFFDLGSPLYENTKEAVGDILGAFYNGVSEHVLILAHTQSGKSGGLEYAAVAMSAVSALCDGPPVVLLPMPTKESAASFQKDLYLLREVHGEVEFYNTQTGSAVNLADLAIHNQPRTSYDRAVNTLHEIQEELGGDLIILSDETDYGSNAYGILDEITTAVMAKGKVRYCYCTATAAEIEGRPDVAIVKCQPGEGYRGMKDIAIVRASDYIPALRGIDTPAVKGKGRARNPITQAIADFIFNDLSKGKKDKAQGKDRFNGKAMNGGRAIMIRVPGGESADRFNREMKRLADRYNRENPRARKFEVVYHAHRGGGLGDIREIMNNYRQKNVIFIVTGSCRRATRVPKECAVFLDLTCGVGTDNAIKQGLVGRATGYGKENSIVMLMDAPYEIVIAGRDDPFLPMTKPLRMEGNGSTVRNKVFIDFVKGEMQISRNIGRRIPVSPKITSAMRKGIFKVVSAIVNNKAGQIDSYLPTNYNSKCPDPKKINTLLKKGILRKMTGGGCRRFGIKLETLLGGPDIRSDFLDQVRLLFQNPLVQLATSSDRPANVLNYPDEGYIALSLSRAEKIAGRAPIGRTRSKDRNDDRGIQGYMKRPEVTIRAAPGEKVTEKHIERISIWLDADYSVCGEYTVTEDSMHHESNRANSANLARAGAYRVPRHRWGRMAY